MTDNPRKITLHDEGGKFARGNPGRPMGAKAQHSRLLLAQVKAMGPAAIEGLAAATANGERWAIEIVLHHSLPGDRTIELDELNGHTVRDALAAGEITVGDALKLAATLAKIAEIEELELIRSRLDWLEGRLRNASS